MSQEQEGNRGIFKRLFGRAATSSGGCCDQQAVLQKKAAKRGGCCNIEIIDLDEEEKTSKQPK